MSKSPPKKQPRLDEAPATEAATLTAPGSLGSGASQRQSAQADETEQKAAAAWVESTTIPFPTGLPMEHKYLERELYVRTCYSKYYEEVMDYLSDPDTEVVTVTGTPGIGKSVFCAYFLMRFSFEAKEATIITASFSRESVLKKVAVWEGGKMLGSAAVDFTDSSDVSAVIKNAKRQATNKLLYLIDGPPKIHLEDAQSVVFASPNGAWFEYIMKDSTRPMVIMPLWTIKELETAAIVLDLTVRVGKPQSSRHANNTTVEPEDVPVAPTVADLVEQRFQIFGGVARACLSRKEAFVKKQQYSIETTVKKFKDILGLQAILNQEKEHEKMYHRICYFVPNEVDPTEYTIAEPTPFVKQLLIECLRDLIKSERKIMVNLLKHNTAAASFRGMLFENSVHNQLNSGYRFEARELAEEDSTHVHTFECARSTPQVAGKTWCYFDENFSASVLSSGLYHVPTSKRFASVDATCAGSSALVSVPDDGGKDSSCERSWPGGRFEQAGDVRGGENRPEAGCFDLLGPVGGGAGVHVPTVRTGRDLGRR